MTQSAPLPFTIGDRYRVARPLGQGGMASVFQCWDIQLHRWCAVKLMSEGLNTRPSLRRQFSSEARTLAQLAHPHVVQIFDLVDDVPCPYLVTEYLEGGAALDLPCPLHPHHAATLCAQVARALEAAHRAGVVHRDVKPANILLDRGGQAKLGDFGIAMLLTDRRQGVAGTLEYMAPEQATGQAGPLSDVFALGATLFVLLCGAEPQHLQSDLREPMLELLPELLRPIVRRATHARPTERCSAAELAQELERAARMLAARDLGPLPLQLRPPVERPAERPCPPELVELLAGTRADRGVRTVLHEAALDPQVLTEAELGRSVLKVEAASWDSERLLEAARTLERLRGPAIPEVLSTGSTPGGGRWVALRYDAEGEPLETYAKRLPPGRRAAWLLPLARQVSAILAEAHAQGAAHGALGRAEEGAVGCVRVHAGAVSQVTGWGGPRLLELPDPAPERFVADVRAAAGLYAWCAGDRLPSGLRAVVQRGLQGKYPDLVAFERDRAAAERGSERWARLRRGLIGGALGTAALAAASVAGLGWLGSRLLASPEPAKPQPLPALAPEPVEQPATPQELAERILASGAILDRVVDWPCDRPGPLDAYRTERPVVRWKPAALDASRELLRTGLYGDLLLASESPDRTPQGFVPTVLVTSTWVVRTNPDPLLVRRAGHGHSYDGEVAGTVDDPQLLEVNDDWIVVANRDGSVSVFSQRSPLHAKLPSGPPIQCLTLEGRWLAVGREDHAMEVWRLLPQDSLPVRTSWEDERQKGPISSAPSDPGVEWQLKGGALTRIEGETSPQVADDVVAYLPYHQSVAILTQRGRLILWSEAYGPAVQLQLPSPFVALRLQGGLDLQLQLDDRFFWVDGCILEIANGPSACAETLAPLVPRNKALRDWRAP